MDKLKEMIPEDMQIHPKLVDPPAKYPEMIKLRKMITNLARNGAINRQTSFDILAQIESAFEEASQDFGEMPE